MTSSRVISSRVSVVIPTFNRCDLLAHALSSVVSQTTRPHEIVVVDDGSTDATQEVLRDFAEQHPEIKMVLLRQQNLGPAAARNAGVKAASGELIAFLDDDDIWLPQKTERQLSVFAADPGLVLLGTASDILALYRAFSLMPVGEKAMLFRNWFMTPTVMVRREVVLENGGFPEDMRQCEDYALWLRIAANHKCAFLNENLVRCGHGKPPFGHSGLSANLDMLYAAEKEAFRRWRSERSVSLPAFFVVSLHAWLRHVRRKLIASRQQA